MALTDLQAVSGESSPTLRLTSGPQVNILKSDHFTQSQEQIEMSSFIIFNGTLVFICAVFLFAANNCT